MKLLIFSLYSSCGAIQDLTAILTLLNKSYGEERNQAIYFEISPYSLYFPLLNRRYFKLLVLKQ